MPTSIYLHIPFCARRCSYCDFNTYAGKGSLIPAYVEAVCREIDLVLPSAPKRVEIHTVFFGGGTPSLLSYSHFRSIIRTINAGSSISTDEEVETSLEANPGTVSARSLTEMRKVGFNRISLGMQSANPKELHLLGRIHAQGDTVNAVDWARKSGFKNLNLDLIFGLPGQTIASWQDSIRKALALDPEHFSLYALTIEKGTPFGRWVEQGRMTPPDPDLAADMYLWASEMLEKQGYQQYEISNWSRPGYPCRHNLQYWRNQPYLGFGAGAHGFANGMRVANVLQIKTYLNRLMGGESASQFPSSPATVTRTRISEITEMKETMMTGLRLTREGISAETFKRRFGKELMEIFGGEINELIGLGLLEQFYQDGITKGIRLTPRGRLLGNQVFMRFV